jgi:hypothetical protein
MTKEIGDVATQVANKKITIKINVQIVDIIDVANVIHLDNKQKLGSKPKIHNLKSRQK